VIPERFAPQTYALLRIVAALVFLNYGLQKFGMFGGTAAPFLAWPLGVAGLIEVVCGGLLLIGLLARPAAFLASGEMAFAYFMVHASQGPTPVQNRGQAAVLFCFIWLYVASRGAGIWSVDAMRKGKK
jgi:putative oxidoreductase